MKCVWEECSSQTQSFERNKVFIQSLAYSYSRNISTKSYRCQPIEERYVYIAHINDFPSLDAVIIPVGTTTIFQQVLLLIPADSVIDSSGYYYHWFKWILVLIPADVSIVDSNGC